MKITSLYTHSRKIPWVTLTIILCCAAITSIAVIFPQTYEKLELSNHPKYLWQYVSGVFLHGDGSGLPMAIAHLTANLLMLVPYAVMVEKLIGSKKFGIIFLSTWLGISAVFQIFALLTVPAGKMAQGAGLSGSSYAVIAMGAFVLYRVFLIDKKKFFCQPLAYIFLSGLILELLMLVMLAPIVAGVSSMVVHLSGLVIGIILTIIYKKDICNAIDSLA